MFLKEIQAKGIFKTRIELAGAFKVDPEKNDGVRKARSEIASFTSLVAAYQGGADKKALEEAREGLRIWNGILDQSLAELQKENDELKEYSEIFRDEWILMREPRGEEIVGNKTVSGDGQTTDGATFVQLFPECLVDWSLKRDEKEKASKEEVLQLILGSSSLYAHVLEIWGKSLPLARRSGRASIAPLAR